jgi:uncharacterized protein Usg
MEKLLTKSVLVNVIYFRPDYRSILQEFIWTTDDIVPELVRVHRFLNFWRMNLTEAPIYEVSIYVSNGEFQGEKLAINLD